MLKILFFMLFMMPLCFLNNMYWMVQILLFFVMFMFMFMNGFNFYWMNLSYFLGCDMISYGLILLSLWICSLMLLASESIFRYNYYSNFFLFFVLVLLIMLYCTFSSTNLFMFYLFFESSLIPTLFLIIGWGYQPERIQAGIYLLFYTLLASLPMLVGIFFIYMNKNILFLFMFNMFNYNYILLYMCMICAFLVKMPMFLVHLWLPKAHVEAPIAGSMILAGIMLKLGGYGLLRIFMMMMMIGVYMNYIWIGISLIGGTLISLICLRQSDLKSLIAYSSVAHMGIVLGGLMTLSYWGFCGSYVLMISHGLCSSGLFCLVNITYERLGSRSLFISKGLLNFMPSMALWWLIWNAVMTMG